MKGKGCVYQIFVTIMKVDEFIRKDEKLYAAFIDLEKT